MRGLTTPRPKTRIPSTLTLSLTSSLKALDKTCLALKTGSSFQELLQDPVSPKGETHDYIEMTLRVTPITSLQKPEVAMATGKHSTGLYYMTRRDSVSIRGRGTDPPIWLGSSELRFSASARRVKGSIPRGGICFRMLKQRYLLDE